MQIWASYACTDRSGLPSPGRVVGGPSAPLTAPRQWWRSSPSTTRPTPRRSCRATLAGSVDCGASAVSADAVARPIDGDVWTEIVTAKGSTAHVTVVQLELDADEVAAIVAEFS